MTDRDLLLTIAVITAAILAVVLGGIYVFARFSQKEKAGRERQINTAVEIAKGEVKD